MVQTARPPDPPPATKPDDGLDPDGWPRWVPRPPRYEDLWQEDEPLESDAHVTQVFSMRDALRHRFLDNPAVFVGANMPVYFSALQVKNRDFRAPDLFVVLDAKPGIQRDFWIVWEEERTPDLVVEVLSDSTAEVDRGRKKDIYERVLKVPDYFLFDLRTGVIEGFKLEHWAYVPIRPNESGRYPAESLGVELGVVDGVLDGRKGRWLRFFEPDGRLVPIAAEAAQAEALAAQAQVQAAQAEAQALAERLAAYEARFGKL